MVASSNSVRADAQQVDELRSVLSNRHCRFVLHHFSDASENAASLEDLSTAFATENNVDADQVAVRLHHVALPKLSSIGVLDYDAQFGTVQYSAPSTVENRLRIGESEPEYVVLVQ